jgi:pyridinium-3,5-bisthiocarboxylic acid mononucleotide nickel chelatase
MKTLYLDIFSGISGDMFIGAMLDLGVDAHAFEHELEKLGLHEYHLHVSRQERGAIAGTKFDVHLAHAHEHEHAHSHEHSHGGVTHTHEHGHHHSHEHEHHEHGDESHAHEHGAAHHDHLANASHGPHGGPLVATKSGRVELSVFETDVAPRFRLYFFDEYGHEAKPLMDRDVILETTREGSKRQTFKFKKRGVFLEATSELPEPHEFQAVLKIKRGSRTEKYETQFVEEHHHHGHEHSHDEQEHVHGRTFADIRRLIERSKLSPWVKEKAVAVFHRVAVAEGKIHGHPPEKVHFHEVGAVDSIVDIVGACIALEMLGKPRVLAGNPMEGTGTIRCAHGTFPIPAPATLEILSARKVAIQQCEEPGELITPTGAAILAEFAESFGTMQGLAVEKIGYGLGTRQNKTRPNVLRAVLGESKVQGSRSKVGSSAELDWQTDTVAVLETNLDDINAELLGAFVEKALAAGALDVFHTPVQMKKNRPGTLLTVLCASADADTFSEMMLRETTAFGVRRTATERRKLRRESTTVKTKFGNVTVKLGRLNGRAIQASPEFESCRKLAEQAGVTVREVYEAAIKAVNV